MFLILGIIIKMNKTQKKNTILQYFKSKTDTDDDANTNIVEKSTDITVEFSSSDSKTQKEVSAVLTTDVSSTSSTSSSVGRTFQIVWIEKYSWLKYDNKMDVVFCDICTTAVNVIGMSTNNLSKNDAVSLQVFVNDGFKNWKKALERFSVHENGSFHRNSLLAVNNVKSGINVVQSLNSAKIKERKDNRFALIKIISSLKFLCGQGLAIRGHTDERSNLHKLLLLRAEDSSVLKSWINRSKYKWMSHDTIEELINIMSITVQRSLIQHIKKSKFYAIMLDETPDISQKEQVSICFRTVSHNVEISETFLGFYETKKTDSETLYTIITDVLERFELKLNACRGQCFDGAYAMSGHLSGLQKRIIDHESRAIYVHCSAHSLNLVVQDAMQDIRAVADFLYTMRELINFIRGSPKRLACFEALQADTNTNITDFRKLRPFCPTRWCLRIISLITLHSNYETVILFLQELYSSEKGEIVTKASGFLKSLLKFETLFLMIVLIEIFEKIEILNTQLQKHSLNYSNVAEMVQILKSNLYYQREGFELLWQKVITEAKKK